MTSRRTWVKHRNARMLGKYLVHFLCVWPYKKTSPGFSGAQRSTLLCRPGPHRWPCVMNSVLLNSGSMSVAVSATHEKSSTIWSTSASQFSRHAHSSRLLWLNETWFLPYIFALHTLSWCAISDSSLLKEASKRLKQAKMKTFWWYGKNIFRSFRR